MKSNLISIMYKDELVGIVDYIGYSQNRPKIAGSPSGESVYGPVYITGDLSLRFYDKDWWKSIEESDPTLTKILCYEIEDDKVGRSWRINGVELKRCHDPEALEFNAHTLDFKATSFVPL